MTISQLDRNAQPNAANETLKNETREQRRARLVSILDRGVVHDRLHVEVPPNKHVEWVRNTPLDVDAMKVLGFSIDTEFAVKRNIHSDGTSANVVGDVIAMVCDKEVKEDIDWARAERLKRVHNPRAGKAEREFQASVDPEIQPSTNSSLRSVTLNEALAKVNDQTSPK